MLFEIAMRTN